MNRGRRLALYDLASDPGEARDVAAAHPDVVAQVRGFLAGARTEEAAVVSGER